MNQTIDQAPIRLADHTAGNVPTNRGVTCTAGVQRPSTEYEIAEVRLRDEKADRLREDFDAANAPERFDGDPL